VEEISAEGQSAVSFAFGGPTRHSQLTAQAFRGRFGLHWHFDSRAGEDPRGISTGPLRPVGAMQAARASTLGTPPLVRRRPLVYPSPARPATGPLIRQRPHQRQQQPHDPPAATPEQQQQFAWSGPISPPAPQATAPQPGWSLWHSDAWKEEYRKQVRVVNDSSSTCCR
jgi:hypothetical protein